MIVSPMLRLKLGWELGLGQPGVLLVQMLLQVLLVAVLEAVRRMRCYAP